MFSWICLKVFLISCGVDIGELGSLHTFLLGLPLHVVCSSNECSLDRDLGIFGMLSSHFGENLRICLGVEVGVDSSDPPYLGSLDSLKLSTEDSRDVPKGSLLGGGGRCLRSGVGVVGKLTDLLTFWQLVFIGMLMRLSFSNWLAPCVLESSDIFTLSSIMPKALDFTGHFWNSSVGMDLGFELTRPLFPGFVMSLFGSRFLVGDDDDFLGGTLSCLLTCLAADDDTITSFFFKIGFRLSVGVAWRATLVPSVA